MPPVETTPNDTTPTSPPAPAAASTPNDTAGPTGGTATPGADRRRRPVLAVVVGSTRPGRVGLPVARWVHDQAEVHGAFDTELVDLAEVALPLLDEPNHPRLGHYQHEHTHAWSATVGRADAFVFVTPEYNHGYPASLKNAIDYLYAEWRDKPVGFVSYGGVAGGTRAVAQLKTVVSPLKMVPVPEGVIVPFVHKMMTDGRFQPGDVQERSATAMLDELARTTARLSTAGD
jgi:NAD(P)H-dependent FMN reductase